MSFEDQEFPPAKGSLYISPPNSNDDIVLSWKRPVDYCASPPALYVDGSSEGDVQQGALGDCYFLGALSVVAMRDDLLHHLFESADVEQGKYVVKFFKEGEWKRVTIDDQLPCGKHGKPIYGHSAEDHELWVALMEKAYAKLHGSYQALEGGSISEALVDITGGAPEEFDLNDDETTQSIANGQLWKRLLKYQDEQYLMGSAFICDGAAEVDTGNGLLQNHAYGIMRVVETSGLKLMQFRNPWGSKEWNGDYSDHSDKWSDQLKAELGVEALDDGVFWMTFEDFCANMNRIYVVRLYEDDVGEKWQHTKLENEWKGETAGGCVNFATWHNNPQFAIDVTQDTEVYLCVSQPDKRLTNVANRQYTAKIGFCLMEVDDSSFAVSTSPTSDQVVLTTTFLNVREIAKDVELKAGKKYVLVPSTFNAGVELKFVIEVYARHPVEIRPLIQRPVARFNSEWKGESAAGCVNHPTWSNNPQILIKLNGEGEVTVSLAQTVANNTEPTFIGFLLVKSSNRLIAQPSKDDVVAESAITNTARVAATAANVPAGEYVVVPSTFDKGVERSFTIEVAPADRVVSLSDAPDRKGAQFRSRWEGATAGGCPNHRTWRNNPQFLLEASQPTTAEIALSADDVAVPLGWYAFEAEGEARRVLLEPNDIKGRSQFTQPVAKASVDIVPEKPLLILPCTFDAGVVSDFTLKAFGPGLSLRPIKGIHMVSLTSSWSAATAGGCTNHKTWTNNPKFQLLSTEDTRVQLLLALPNEEQTGIGILVSKANPPTRGDLVGESDLIMGTETGLKFDLVANKPVWVMPVTFDQGVEIEFELTCYSTLEVQFGNN